MQRGVTNIGNSRSSNSIKSSLMVFEDRLLPMWENQSVTYVGELPPLCIFASLRFSILNKFVNPNHNEDPVIFH